MAIHSGQVPEDSDAENKIGNHPGGGLLTSCEQPTSQSLPRPTQPSISISVFIQVPQAGTSSSSESGLAQRTLNLLPPPLAAFVTTPNPSNWSAMQYERPIANIGTLHKVRRANLLWRAAETEQIYGLLRLLLSCLNSARVRDRKGSLGESEQLAARWQKWAFLRPARSAQRNAGATSAPAMRVQRNQNLKRYKPNTQAADFPRASKGAFNCWRRLPAKSATTFSFSATEEGTSPPLSASCE
jgi:hypothetical protein